MAKTSVIVRNDKRAKLANKQYLKRKELKKIILDETANDNDRYEASVKLQKLPRNGAPVRVVKRCVLTGRSRGVLTKFGLSRIKFRELALKGHLPGITKSSW